MKFGMIVRAITGAAVAAMATTWPLASASAGENVAWPGVSTSPPTVNAQGENATSVRQELNGLKRLLWAQQERMERQELKIKQLETELTDDGEHDSLQVRVGGQYRVMYNSSNFGFHPVTLDDSQESQTFFNQRFRTWLAVSPNENVEGYLQVEMGHILWGDDGEFPKVFDAELRRGYLTYKDADNGLFRVGIQDWHDAFGESPTLGTFHAVDDYDSMAAILANSVWDFNVGGLSYTNRVSSLGDMTLNAGAFALFEGDVQDVDDAMLFAFDADWTLSDDHSVGFSVYYLPDFDQHSFPTAAPYDWAWDVWLGVRGKLALDPVPVNGFVLYNTGRRNELGAVPDFNHDAVALKLEAGPIPLARGELHFQTLYAADGFRTIAQSERDDFGSQGYWSYLILTSPHGPSDVNDLGVSVQNRGLGLFTVQAKYDYPLCGRLSGTTAVGWLRADEDNPTSGEAEMGTELVEAFTLDLGGGMNVIFGGAVFFAGDFYKTSPSAPGPDELWEIFTRMQLEL